MQLECWSDFSFHLFGGTNKEEQEPGAKKWNGKNKQKQQSIAAKTVARQATRQIIFVVMRIKLAVVEQAVLF